MMLKHPGLRATTAMKRLSPPPNETLIRRLQEKWKVDKAVLMKRAEERREDHRSTARAGTSKTASGGAAGWAGLDRQMRLVDEVQRSMGGTDEIERQIRAVDQMSSILESHKLLADYNSPTMKMMRSIEDHPAIKMARQLEESPALRAIRQWEMMQKRLGF
tara:strand:+ start:148725 stop:149207 length:483 start_codon:yes stop_codon:yes gene_type:complete